MPVPAAIFPWRILPHANPQAPHPTAERNDMTDRELLGAVRGEAEWLRSDDFAGRDPAWLRQRLALTADLIERLRAEVDALRKTVDFYERDRQHTIPIEGWRGER
jgi:hypothetical protein